MRYLVASHINHYGKHHNIVPLTILQTLNVALVVYANLAMFDELVMVKCYTWLVKGLELC